MGIITEVSRQKRNENRVNVYVDGEFAAGLDAVVAAGNGLKKGVEISAEELARIERQSEDSSAFEKATKYLGFRARTEREMRRYLMGKGYSEQTAARTIERLKEYDLIDDAEFCREFVAAKSKKLGASRIKNELRRLGADEEAAEEAIAALEGQADRAFEVAEKYIRTHRALDMNKLKRHLYSRGFSPDDISAAAGRVKEEYGDEFGEEDET